MIFIFWPVKGLLLPGNWWGKTLIILMNDSEARPCGGFVTAFGVLDVPSFKMELKNVYHFSKVDYGSSFGPLKEVSKRQKFWDLGTSLDLEQCSYAFASGYEKAEGARPDQVILVQSSFLENWVSLFSSLDLEKESVSANQFFGTVSRSVANVDRHDEGSLESRKQPLVALGKQLIKKTIFQPWQWHRFTYLVRDSINSNKIYWLGHSNSEIDFLETQNLVSIAEWNLGGGKSSRYLRKSWSVDLRETSPNKWKAHVRILADHLGGFDEPISQNWKGGFELNFYGQDKFVSAAISPGQSWSESVDFELSSEQAQSIFLYTPAYQNWRTDFSVSLFSQKVLEGGKEGLGYFRGNLPVEGKLFDWEVLEDRTSPFLVIHQPIGSAEITEDIGSQLNFQEGDLLVELKFNEKVEILESFEAQLIDRGVAQVKTHENPKYESHLLLENQQTLLVNFTQKIPQRDERFDLQISGVSDLWGNKAGMRKRTIIAR